MGRATYGSGVSRAVNPTFQPTPSSYGEGDARAGPTDRAARAVSTHALLIWGGRPRPRFSGASCCPSFNPRPPHMGRATPFSQRSTQEPGFQPTPSSYGEGDSPGQPVLTPVQMLQPTPSSFGE